MIFFSVGGIFYVTFGHIHSYIIKINQIMKRKSLLLTAILFSSISIFFAQSKYYPDEMILKFKDLNLNEYNTPELLEKIGGVKIDSIPSEQIYHYKFKGFPLTNPFGNAKDGSGIIYDILELLTHTMGQADVDGGSLNYIISPFSIIPAVPNTLLIDGPILSSLSYCEAYAETFPASVGGENPIKIGIIDTGVDKEFILNTFGEWVSSIINLNNDPSDPVYGDSHGHGTLVTGIIAGMLSHMGAENARITMIKVFDGHGQSHLFRILQALTTAYNTDLEILNLSFGFTPDPNDSASNLFKNLVSNLSSKGVLMFVAAGNKGLDLHENDYYPASLNRIHKVVTVGSVDCNENYSDFSNYGSHKVDIAAPGESIFAQGKDDIDYFSSGTSLSTAFASGLAAIYSSQAMTFDADETLCMIEASAAIDPTLYEKVRRGRVLHYQSPEGLNCMDNYSLPELELYDGPNINPLRIGFTPNPFTDFLELSVTLQQPEQITIQLYDLNGRSIWEHSFVQEAGNHIIPVTIHPQKKIPTGIYFAKVGINGQMHSYKLIKH